MNPREMAERFAQALNEKFAAVPDYKYAGTLSVAPGGRKYIRIVTTYDNGGRSVHAFVDATTGALLKAAGWAGPAKGVRGDLFSAWGFDAAVAQADPYGSYLYK